jgi:hypothetical protein
MLIRDFAELRSKPELFATYLKRGGISSSAADNWHGLSTMTQITGQSLKLMNLPNSCKK